MLLTMALEPSTALGPYAVAAKIGEGGMGEVYQARNTRPTPFVADAASSPHSQPEA